MRRRAIIVNGVPASGKSTVAAHVVAGLASTGQPAVPLALDTLKEALFADLGIGDRDYNRMLGRASYRGIFASIAAFPDALIPVIDAWHGFQPPELLAEHLHTARIDRAVELWCDVSPDMAAARYRGRPRLPGHPPADYADELRELAARVGPLERFGPVIRVDTERSFDPSVCDRIMSLLDG